MVSVCSRGLTRTFENHLQVHWKVSSGLQVSFDRVQPSKNRSLTIRACEFESFRTRLGHINTCKEVVYLIVRATSAVESASLFIMGQLEWLRIPPIGFQRL